MRTSIALQMLFTTLAMVVLLGGCTQSMHLRTQETAVNGKRAHLAERRVYLAEPRDARAVRDKIGEHYQAQANGGPDAEGPTSMKVMDYKSDVPLTQDVKEALRLAFKAGGAEIVSAASEADLQIQAEIQRFFVVTTDTYELDDQGMAKSVVSTSKGDVALRVAVLDAKGFEVGSVPFEGSFDDSGDRPELLAVTLNQVIAEVVDSELVVKVASAAGSDDTAVADDADASAGAEQGTGRKAHRVFLRFEGDRKNAGVLSSKGAYFQGPVLERGGIEFAGSGEMEKVYEGLCSEMGVGADELRKCRLQAAGRIYVEEIIELSVRQPAKGEWELTLEVWKPETNGLVSAKAVRVPTASLDEAAETALPQLACAYLTYRGDAAPCAAQ